MNLKKKQIGPGIVVVEMADRITSGRDCQRINEEVERLIREGQTRVSSLTFPGSITLIAPPWEASSEAFVP
jgi:hypothetical protein